MKIKFISKYFYIFNILIYSTHLCEIKDTLKKKKLISKLVKISKFIYNFFYIYQLTLNT